MPPSPPGAPSNPPSTTRRVYVILPESMLARLEAFGRATQRDRSSSIRYALSRMLRAWEEDGGGG